MARMQAVPVFFSTVKPLTANPAPPGSKMVEIVGCILLLVMGIAFHILSDTDSVKGGAVWISKTSIGRTVGWLSAKFWDWGVLSWFVVGLLLPIGVGVAMGGMYLIGRYLIAIALALMFLKVIHDAGVAKRSISEIAWVVGITAVVGIVILWGCFWVIGEIEWEKELVVKMTFKQSAVLTDQRQRDLEWEMNKYFLYLKKVGFDLPAEIPPLGLTPPHGIIVIGGPTTGPISTHSLFIPEDAIENIDNMRFAYSVYTFNRLLVWPDMLKPGMSRVEAEHDEVASWIAECYFSASFTGHQVCDKGTPGYKWQEGLWEVRSQLGQGYTDGLVCYTVNLWRNVPPKYVGNFDHFFRYKLVSGESVKGNSNTGREMDAIFKRHGIDVP
jgi:hypothetical protein